jgi:uncharacterized protein YaiL (DUF2058 family)
MSGIRGGAETADLRAAVAAAAAFVCELAASTIKGKTTKCESVLESRSNIDANDFWRQKNKESYMNREKKKQQHRALMIER